MTLRRITKRQTKVLGNVMLVGGLPGNSPEIAVENCEVFLHAGGEDYQYIKALNDSPCHIQLFRQLVLQQLQGW